MVVREGWYEEESANSAIAAKSAANSTMAAVYMLDGVRLAILELNNTLRAANE